MESTLNEAAEFQMCRLLIQAIKALVVYTLNRASLKTIEASALKKAYELRVLTVTKPCRDKMNAWWVVVFVCGWWRVCFL